MNPIVTAGGLVLNDKGEIVVVRQSHKFIPWSLPKGKIEPGEDVLAAAIREIKEEAGITELELVKKLPVYERPLVGKDGKNSAEIKQFHYFIFKTTQTDLKPIDPANPEAIWISVDQLIDYLTHPKDKGFFTLMLDEIKLVNSV